VHVVLAQINSTVGALRANADHIRVVAREAAAAGAQLVAFPELALSGYPPEDLVLKPHFLEDVEVELRWLARELPPGLTAVVGAPRHTEGQTFNAAVVFQGGQEILTYRKMLLPNYGVFDEKRVFAAGTQPGVIEVGGLRIGLHICEDSWYVDEAPCQLMAKAGVDAVLNISASPYHRGKQALRERILTRAASHIGAPLLYCNLVGGQDELVFDGGSMVASPEGVLARAKQFQDDQLAFPLAKSSNDWKSASAGLPTIGTFPSPLATAQRSPRENQGQVGGKAGSARIEPVLPDLAEVYAALTLGLRDYANKNGFKGVVLGLSGGIDSALVAALAVDALGADRVHGITMPSRFSSSETLGDAHRVASNLGIHIVEVPIKSLHELYLAELAPLWPGRAPDTTEENLQARIRGNLVMALSNKFGWLVLTTGNKSELATGYCTLYGDMAGGFAVIKDVPKTLVFELARWRNESAGRELIPASTIDRPPTAELRANQKDQDSLPPYDVLDGILERYVERDESVAGIVAAGFDEATVRKVIRLVDLNEYKRRQGAPGVKITPKAFGRDRRLPITNRYGERT
jgi:NAD+ synthase (glutamine-hydrolysing)